MDLSRCRGCSGDSALKGVECSIQYVSRIGKISNVSCPCMECLVKVTCHQSCCPRYSYYNDIVNKALGIENHDTM